MMRYGFYFLLVSISTILNGLSPKKEVTFDEDTIKDTFYRRIL